MGCATQYEFYAQDPERAIRFYKEVFGWKAVTWAGPWNTWLITTGPDLGISPGAQDRGIYTIEVARIDETAVRIRAAGGQIIEPAFPLPGIGLYSLCADSEGNKFGLMQAEHRSGQGETVPPRQE